MSIAYFRSEQGHEVNFLARSPDGKPQAIQVAESLADAKTRERELRGLAAAMAERKLSRGTVVTLDEEDAIDVSGGTIDVIPAWRWMLRRE